MKADALVKAAKAAMQKAYAPYSKFTVGCALEGSGEKIYSGCNVENASYGATLCAERVTISHAVSQGERKFKKLVLISKNPEPITPCGLCLQVMAEFLSPNTEITCYGLDEKASRTYKFKDLFPHTFTKENL